MKEKKLVLRTCVLTRETLEKKDLIRIVRSKEGVVSVDLTGKANGRGAYLKKDIDDIKEKLKSISELAHTEYEAIRQQTIQFKNSPNVVEEIQTRFLKKEKKDVQNK